MFGCFFLHGKEWIYHERYTSVYGWRNESRGGNVLNVDQLDFGNVGGDAGSQASTNLGGIIFPYIYIYEEQAIAGLGMNRELKN